MMLLALALLPGLLWDEPPASVEALREAGITSIYVPAERYKVWKKAGQFAAQPADIRHVMKLPAPAVLYRNNIASATSAPWLVSNGWRFLRSTQGRFLYEAQGTQAALAAAEAFCFGGSALVHTGGDGLKPFAEMIEFLRGLGESDAAPLADIGFIDDGSATAGEVMNLMVRDNLLFQVVSGTGPQLKLTVRLGSKEFPLKDARNPSMAAHEVRAQLTDDRRSIRVYGSEVVVARLTALPDGVRVHLLNYAGAERKVDGLRVRVLGQYAKHRLAAAGSPQAELLDYSVGSDATEFTLPELKTYAVIDLSR
jgi:hypothetical protein